MHYITKPAQHLLWLAITLRHKKRQTGFLLAFLAIGAFEGKISINKLDKQDMKTETRYIADDGKEFHCEQDCRAYEAQFCAKDDPYAELKAAHARGETIQCNMGNVGWWDISLPLWTYPVSSYRIKPLSFPEPPEAQAWHNPDGLNAEQIGVNDGWRLLLDGEEIHPQDEYFFADEWDLTCAKIGQRVGVGLYNADYTMRTKRPLPTPPKRVPLETSDLPPVCWLRYKDNANCAHLVLWVGKYAVHISANSPSYPTFSELFRDGWQYSADRVNWKPCHKFA